MSVVILPAPLPMCLFGVYENNFTRNNDVFETVEFRVYISMDIHALVVSIHIRRKGCLNFGRETGYHD